MQSECQIQCKNSVHEANTYLSTFAMLGVLVTAIPIIIEGRFQLFQRFSSSKLVPKTVESCFVALNYYGNGSMVDRVCLKLNYVNVNVNVCAC